MFVFTSFVATLWCFYISQIEYQSIKRLLNAESAFKSYLLSYSANKKALLVALEGFYGCV